MTNLLPQVHSEVLYIQTHAILAEMTQTRVDAFRLLRWSIFHVVGYFPCCREALSRLKGRIVWKANVDTLLCNLFD